MKATCQVTGCDRPVEARGWCHTHYEHWRRQRTVPTRPVATTMEARFLAKVIVSPGGHWIWVGARRICGGTTYSGITYGHIRYEGKLTLAHRVSWLLFRGPIPAGLHIDHLCRLPICVRPLHLDPVTPRVNVHRSWSPPARNAAKTHCLRGHPFDAANTYVKPSGGRHCRICRTTAQRLSRSRR